MSNKERQYKELTLSDRKALFASRYVTCKDGKVEHGQKVRSALKFEVASKTVSRVWEDICSVMENHLVEKMELEQLQHSLSRGHYYYDSSLIMYLRIEGKSG
jgi:hypothetical protein